MNIMIVGAGGVGGYLAAMLCRKYDDITLIARGTQLAAIQENGLTLIIGDETFTVHPHCTATPAQAGMQDIIVLCTKGYGLDAVLDQIAPCVGPHTLLIPFLNGINTHRDIAARLTQGVALDGCIYVSSFIREPGVIQRVGTVDRLYMGVPGLTAAQAPQALHTFRDMLTACGVSAEVSDDIIREMWIKWTFIVAHGQACAYFNVPIGTVRETPHMWEFLLGLLDEVLLLAAAEGICLPADLRERQLAAFRKTPPETTPSVMLDLNVPGKPTEIGRLAGEVCRLADKHGLDVPHNRSVLARFSDRV